MKSGTIVTSRAADGVAATVSVEVDLDDLIKRLQIERDSATDSEAASQQVERTAAAGGTILSTKSACK
jgi:hypothetical protein